jgi:hypothetical protein
MLIDELHPYVTEQIQQATLMFAADLKAMPEEVLRYAPRGARTPLDLAFECAYLMRRLAKRLREEPVEPFPWGEGYATAPNELNGRDSAIANLQAASQDLLASLGHDLNRFVTTSAGQERAYAVALFGAVHTIYHDGQLNYIQASHGDQAMHWSD